MTEVSTEKPTTFFITALTLFLFSLNNCYATKTNYIEFTQSIDSITFDSIKTVGLFFRKRIKNGGFVYGGLQFSNFEFLNSSTTSGIFRVIFGTTTNGTIAPFAEIGTNIIGILIISSDNQTNCGNENRCRIDGIFKAGLRIHIQNTFTLGLFHEIISFDGNHSLLRGDHNYTGVGIGYLF